MNNFTHCEANISLEKVIKSINSQTHNKSPGNYGLTAEVHKHFSNELSPILLYFYQSWEKLRTTGVSSRAVVISDIYRKDDKYMANYRPVSLLNLDYKIYTTMLNYRLQKA